MQHARRGLDKMRNIIFIAPPAAGKGTISDVLVKNYNYEHISTGDLLREEIKSGSDLGKELDKIISQGKLVNDEFMINLMENCLPFEVIRNKEFAPIKNKTGIDSVESARELLKENNVTL